ncbi:MAG TPA: MFS transporter [Casimicrobiaceae bacterium]|nr:MFS transporter [Casimicrobiaceae bacterium]
MKGGEVSTTRTLAALILLGIANHTVLSGSRVIVSLDALSMGASPFTVGVLMALYALLPMLLSVAAGRVSDRVDYRWPMRIGSALVAIGAVLPIAFPGFPALFASALLIGVGFMAFQIAAQSATGEVGGLKRRTRNFTLLSLGFSISGFIGPLVAGFAIDHFGFRAAFALFALIPLIPITALSGRRFDLPARAPHAGPKHHGGMLALLRHRTLRRVFAMNALLSMSWDLHSIFVPIYGERIGLSASEIGVLLSAFAAATFAVRFFMGRIARRLTEHQVLTGALLLAGAVYLVYPLSTSMLGLLALSFTLGLGLGSGQPMVLSLLHTHAPPGRVGEAAGVRLSLINAMSVGVPLALGAVGSSVGIGPVFWSVGTCLVTCGFVAKRNGPR